MGSPLGITIVHQHKKGKQVLSGIAMRLNGHQDLNRELPSEKIVLPRLNHQSPG
jgi:hypothetical protein